MVVSHGSSKQFPGTVVIAEIGVATRLGDTTVGVEVSVGNVGANTKATNAITAIGVDSFDVNTVTGPDAVGVVVP